MKWSQIVGVVIDGVETWHAPNGGGGDYLTLCGLDGFDDHEDVGQQGTVEPRRGQRIDCPQCFQVWEGVAALRLRRNNFQ